MEGSAKKSKNNKTKMIIAGIMLICVAIVCVAGILMQGGTTVTGSYEGLRKREALTCESDLMVYPLFKFDESIGKSLKINVIFGEGGLGSISLLYKLDYTNIQDARFSEAYNHAEMNKTFSKDGLGVDALGVKYGVLSDGLQFSIYSKGDEISNKILKYFMLDDVGDIKNLTREKMTKVYNNIGLNCKIEYNYDYEEENEK